MMVKIGISSKKVKSILVGEKIMQESIILSMENMQMVNIMVRTMLMEKFLQTPNLLICLNIIKVILVGEINTMDFQL